MLARKIVNSIKNYNYHPETMAKVIMGASGIIGTGYGGYHGYMVHRCKSYTDCVIETTMSSLVGAGVGMGGAMALCFVSPLLVPLVCLFSIPVASIAVITKYFDDDAK